MKVKYSRRISGFLPSARTRRHESPIASRHLRSNVAIRFRQFEVAGERKLVNFETPFWSIRLSHDKLEYSRDGHLRL